MVDYTKYSYDEIVARVTELLRDKEGWGDAYDSSMGQALIRMIADTTDHLHYMLERRTIENYLFTAKTQSAVFARAGELGYRAKRVIANSGSLLIEFLDDNEIPISIDNPLMIPVFTEFEFNGKKYCAYKDVLISAGSQEAKIPVKEGYYEVIEFAESEYAGDNTVTIENYQNIDNASIKVSSNGVEFNDVLTDDDGFPSRRAMSFATPEDELYDIRYETDGMRLILGDGSFGTAPSGDLKVEFIRVDNVDSPVNTIGNEFETSYSIVDNEGVEYAYRLTNDTKIHRGETIEDLESVKENARTYTKTNGRAVTIEDINYWVRESRIGGIVDAKAMGEHELDTVVENINNVYINYLTDSADELTVEEEEKLRKYLSSVLMTTIHPVIRPVDKLFVQTRLDATKHPELEISNSEFYSRLKKFLEGYFPLKENSIGRSIQHSEMVRDLHKQTVTRGGVEYNLVDYVKLDVDAVYPLSIPLGVKSMYVDIKSEYVPASGDEFVLSLQNIVCRAIVDATDTEVDILNKMRDKINELTPFVAKVELGDIAVDGFGNPIPIEVDNNTGDGMLIGTETPYPSPTSIVNPPAVGTTLSRYVLGADSIDVKHYYYSQLAGRRPLIPLRTGTSVVFQAPSDTAVNVYMRTDMSDPATEQLLTTISAGGSFNQTFNSGEHSLQFEYTGDSQQDVIVDIYYPAIGESDIGLKVTTRDGFGSFTVRESSGDLSNYISTTYNVVLPPIQRNISTDFNQILPNSLEILNSDGEKLFGTKTDGRLTNADGSISDSGSVNYITNVLTLPEGMMDGEYFVRYKQNKFQNLKTDNSAAMVLLPISKYEEASNLFSRITLEE